MTKTTHLGLPFIDAAQAQKHVTHNDALGILDIEVHLSAIARNSLTPPAVPVEGMRYLLGAGAKGSFAGHDGALAAFQDGAWRFLTPAKGWRVYVENESSFLLFDGTTWNDIGSTIKSLQNLALAGIGTSADAANPLSAKVNATLFTAKGLADGGTGDLRFKLNKEAVTNTVSQLYQTGYSGRAETGLSGNDHFHVKVSADGAVWKDALDIDPSSGQVSFPAGIASATGPFVRWLGAWSAATAYSIDDAVMAGTATYIAVAANTNSAPPSANWSLMAAASVAGGSNYTVFAGLVRNGYGGERGNGNFSALTFDPTELIAGQASFMTSAVTQVVLSDDLIPVDPNASYVIATSFLSKGGASGLIYAGFAPFDIDGNSIGAQHHMRFAAADTTLAVALKPGDTTMTLTSAAGWNGAAPDSYNRTLVIYRYKSITGHTYAPYGYSRNMLFGAWNVGGITGNVVTLAAPFAASMGNPADAGGIWPVGTEVSNGSSGGAYKYCLNDGTAGPPIAWTRARAVITGRDTSGLNDTFKFAPGTAAVRMFYILNYAATIAGQKQYISGISLDRLP